MKKIIQIIESKHGLVVLDKDGKIWVLDINGGATGWVEIKHPIKEGMKIHRKRQEFIG